MRTAGAGALATAAALRAHGQPTQPLPAMPAARPNILMIAVDDLRPLLGCHGVKWMHTPHIDALAASGTRFQNNYCQFPICGPSRASLMSGVRPTISRFRKWNARIDEDLPGALTLPEHFLQNGYATACLGKVIHDLDDQPQAWSGALWRPESQVGGVIGAYALEENREIHRAGGMGPPVERADVPDSTYGDGMIADRAIQELRGLAAGDAPFLLSVGFLRPHLPFNAPQKYWDLYKREDLPLTEHPLPPKDAPPQSLSNWEELRKYVGMPAKGPVTEAQARELIHGYAASISYMDAQLGRVMAALEERNLRGNTIVVFWADHGWHLGEHGLWSKHCLYEGALRTPLIFSGPGIGTGQVAQGLTENLDIYPTLCTLAGLPVPDHVQGRPLTAQLRDAAAPGKDAVFSRHGKSDSVKTSDFRYTEWQDDGGNIVDRMLYDHRADPDETTNIAPQPQYQEVIAQLSGRLAELRIATV